MKRFIGLVGFLVVAAAAQAQYKVAVFPFYNGTMIVKNDWLGHGFCESLNSDLSEDNTIVVIDRPDVLAEIKAKGYKLSDMKDDQKALVVARSLEVDRMIIGTFDMPAQNVKVLAKFYDVRTGLADAKNTYIAEGKFSMSNVYSMYGQISNRALVSFGKKSIDEIGGPTKGSINIDAYEPYIKAILQYDESGSVEDYFKSIELFEQAVSIDTNYALAYAGMAKAHAKIARLQGNNFKMEEKSQSDQKALAAALRAVKLDKNLATGYVSLALTYRELKDRDKLMEAARRAVKIRPSQYDAYDILADAFSSKFFPANKNIDSAIYFRKKSVEYNTKFASGFRGLGQDYVNRGNYKEAEEAFQKAISLNPKHAGSHDFLGQVYMAQGQYDKAKVEFSEAVKIDPKLTFAHTHMGDLLSMETKYTEAIASYDAALAANPNFADALNGRAWVYLGAKDKKIRDAAKAVESAKAAVGFSENKNAGYLYTLAESQFAAGMPDDALTTIGLALGLDPTNADFSEAEARFKKKEKNSDYIYVVRRGLQFLKQNRVDDGVKEFEEANKLSPKNVFVLLTLARYYDSKKQYKKAFENYYFARGCDWDKKYVKEIQTRMNELEQYSK